MSQLMKDLFRLLNVRPTEEAQAVEAAKNAIQAAEQHLTYDEFDNLWNAIADIYSADDLDSFILGFRLGVQLTLEGLRPIN